MRHQNVWYRSAPKQSRWRPIRAHEDIGVLEVAADMLAFHGKRGDIVLEQPRIVSVGLCGVDTINPWITIEDRDGNRVLFADGSRFGWGGVRGGTVKLVDEIEKALGAKAT